MIDRLVLGIMLGITGWNGLYPSAPAEPAPLTSTQLQAKAKYKSVSNVCNKKKKSKSVKELCERWEKHSA